MTTMPARTMHLFKTTSVLIILVAWSFMVACPATSLLHPKLSRTSTRRYHEKSIRPSIGDDYEKLLPTSMRQVDSLNKRGKDLDLALASFEPGGVLIPLQAAAEVLEAFYSSIATNSQGSWAKNNPRIWIKITWGTIGLLFTATEGTTVPWDFVTWFALEMLRHTERGYTGMYTQSFINPTVGNAVLVSLYHCAIGPLIDPAAVGAQAKLASCLNPEAQAWFPTRRTPTR